MLECTRTVEYVCMLQNHYTQNLSNSAVIGPAAGDVTAYDDSADNDVMCDLGPSTLSALARMCKTV